MYHTFLTEHLSVCIPFGHSLCSYDKLTFHDLNGYNCLLRDQLGFWTDLCKRKIPASKFLIQTDESEFLELVKSSTLFCFSTNYASYPDEILNDRKRIPIVDDCANVEYWVVWKKGNTYRFQFFMEKKNPAEIHSNFCRIFDIQSLSRFAPCRHPLN